MHFILYVENIESDVMKTRNKKKERKNSIQLWVRERDGERREASETHKKSTSLRL
jgi:hypothetical protein